MILGKQLLRYFDNNKNGRDTTRIHTLRKKIEFGQKCRNLIQDTIGILPVCEMIMSFLWWQRIRINLNGVKDLYNLSNDVYWMRDGVLSLSLPYPFEYTQKSTRIGTKWKFRGSICIEYKLRLLTSNAPSKWLQISNFHIDKDTKISRNYNTNVPIKFQTIVCTWKYTHCLVSPQPFADNNHHHDNKFMMEQTNVTYMNHSWLDKDTRKHSLKGLYKSLSPYPHTHDSKHNLCTSFHKSFLSNIVIHF